MVSVTACSFMGYGSKGLSEKEFSDYVEHIFRFQNKLTSEMMVLSDEGQVEPKLSEAEQKMQAECTYLNEYASHDIDGISSSLLLRKRVENSAEDCEHAAHRLEKLLKQVDH